MKHYKDIEDNLFGYEDDYFITINDGGVETEVIPEHLTEITIDEARQIAASKIPVPTLDEKRERATMTPMQFMLALEKTTLPDNTTLLDSAEALVADPATPKRIKIMWNKASSFDRLNPELVQMATALGLTDAQMDAVFGITA